MDLKVAFASELHLNFRNENEFCHIKYMWNYLLNTAI